MEIDPSELAAEQAYKLITGIVVPRPIAWVTTVSPDGVTNLAPFSAFTFLSPKPPLLGISVGRKAAVYKDTARNILTSEEYVIHIANWALLEALHGSAQEFPADVSEITALGLETCPSVRIKPPRIAAAPVSMECRLRHCIEFGETRSRFIVGEVVRFHVQDSLLVDNKIQTAALDPVCRLAGPNYARLDTIVTLAPISATPKS